MISLNSSLDLLQATSASSSGPFGKKPVSPDPSTLKVTLSDAQRAAQEAMQPPSPAEAERDLRNVASLRNQSLAQTGSGNNLAVSAETVSEGVTAFQDFLAHTTGDVDTLSKALSAIFSANTGGGDATSRAMDLTVTQSKLEYIAQKYLSADYQDNAQQLIDRFVSASASQDDAINKAIYQAAADLAESLGDTTYARESQAALQSIQEGNHSSQQERTAIFALADSSATMDERLAKFSQYNLKNETNGYFQNVKREHLVNLSSQWQAFIQQF